MTILSQNVSKIMRRDNFMKNKNFCSILIIIFIVNTLLGQISSDEMRYVNIGSLQSRFSSYGSERAFNGTYYEGMQWPADYQYSDNAIIRRAWYAVQNFTDENGTNWDYWANYLYGGYVNLSIFPMTLKQITKFEPPTVIINGEDRTKEKLKDFDRIDANQIADRIVINKINTSCGLTITRKIYAFSQQYHDNYFIKEYIYKNTGNIDSDSEIELNNTLNGLCFGSQSRYDVSRDGARLVDMQQSWGKHSWITRRGEDYATHADEITDFTENTTHDIFEWLPCAFSWTGQSESISFDMIGCPDYKGNGRLASPQFAGSCVIHADKSTTDHSNDPSKILNIGWHAGDTYPSLGNMEKSNMQNMEHVYNMLNGVPYPDSKHGGSNRFYEDNTTSITDSVDPYTIHGDGGGTSNWISYGPYDLEIGDSVVVVEVEGVNGINRIMCEEIGKRWLAAYNNEDNGPFTLPDGTTTTDKDVYKNSWIYTGMDSILTTFSRATRNYNMNMDIPQPPLPPVSLTINSNNSTIDLEWEASPSEEDDDFVGYRIYRSLIKPDTTYELIAEVTKDVHEYQDINVSHGIAYYYYITSYNNGANNTAGIANPTGSLESNMFYTRSDCALYLKGQSAIENNPNIADEFKLEQNYPNPFNPVTTIKYSISENSFVRLSIYNAKGEEIKSLVNQQQGNGTYQVHWDASDFSSGIYFYKIVTSHHSQTKKMLLLK